MLTTVAMLTNGWKIQIVRVDDPILELSGEKMRFAAPRILNAPPFWKFSHLKNAFTPDSASKACEVRTGVRRAMGRIRSAASRIMGGVTSVCTFPIVTCEARKPVPLIRPPLRVWIPLLLWPAFLKLHVHPDSVPRDARCHAQLLSRCIHHDALRYRVVRLQILGESQVDTRFDDPVEDPLVVAGEEHNRQHELSVASAH